MDLLDHHFPCSVPRVAIRIEDLRAYASADGLRQLLTEAELSEQEIALLVYWYRLDGFWDRDRTLKEVGQLTPEPVPSWSGGVRGSIIRARSKVETHLLAKKSQLG